MDAETAVSSLRTLSFSRAAGAQARPASYDKKVGLVLQGGGALGSYQAGVYEALST
jgi:predicted acylesterase/phospholipase RssA